MSQPPPEFPRYTDRPPDAPPAGPPQDVPGWVPPSGPQQVPYQPPPGAPYPPAPGQPYQYPAPYPAEYGFGYPSGNPPGTSGLAIGALVTGLVGLGPIAVGLGIGALVTMRRTRESGTGMAIAGIVLGALQVLAFGALVVIGIAAGEDDSVADPDVPTQTSDQPVVDIGELGQGECFDETETDFEVIAQPCDTAHDGEVFATLVLAPRAYPGDRAVRDEAEAACDREFKRYVGVDVHASELESDFVYPSRDMWEDGERDVICLAYGPDGETLDRTVKDSKR
jgi:Domain of unknown function (DUF4190)/Septum formation